MKDINLAGHSLGNIKQVKGLKEIKVKPLRIDYNSLKAKWLPITIKEK